MKTTQLITLCFLFAQLHVSCQYYWQNFTTENLFYDIEQVEDDMWFATQGGLIKYHIPTGERENFLPYNSPLKGSEIVSLAEAPDGSLWVGSNGGGIYKYKDGIWTNFKDHINEEHNTSTNITVVSNDEVWFYLQKGQNTVFNRLYRLKDNTLKEFTGFALDAKGWTFMDFAFKDSDNLWLIYRDQISIYNISQEKTVTTYDKTFFTSDIYSVLQYIGKDKSGNGIIHTNGGIYRFVNGSWQELLKPGFNSVSSVKDSKGNLYINAYRTSGKKYNLLFFDGTELKEIDTENFPEHEYGEILPELIYVDDEDIMWFHIYDHPLKPKIFTLKNNEWKAIETTISPIPSNYMRKVITDCDNNVWFLGDGCTIKSGDTYTLARFTDSTAFHGVDIEIDPNTCGVWVSNGANSFSDDAEGLVYLENNTRKSFLKGHYNVYDVEVDKNGVVYVNSWLHGLGIMKDGNWNWYNSSNSLVKSFINHLSLDKDNKLYISTRDNGLIMYDGNKFYSLGFGNPSSIKSHWNYVDNDGNIWMTNDHGLSMFNGLEWIDYSHVYGYDVVSSMVQDKRGNYWVSTWKQGLHYWDRQTITKYTTENSGIRSNFIYNVHQAADNNLWLAELTGATSLTFYSYDDKNKVNGFAYFDKDQSGSFEENKERKLPGQKIINKDNGITTYTNLNGQFAHYLDENAITANLEINPTQSWFPTTSPMIDVMVPQSDQASFGLYAESLPQKVEISIASALPICFTDFNVWVTVINKGLEPLTGNINFSYSEFLKIVNPGEAVDILNDSMLRATITDLDYLEAATFKVVFKAPGEQYFGQDVTYNAQFTSANYTQDTKSIETILCSYDPNDKKAEATGDFVNNYSLIKDPLKYTIRFENEGNYKASTIIITDTLDAHLDPSTFQFITSSHPCEVILSRTGEAKFIFLEINLPSHDETGTESQGFLSYKIAPYENTENHTEINNKAHIFFDSNPPIITNNTTSVVVDDLFITANENSLISDVRIFPNPSNGLIKIETALTISYEVFTSLGQICQKGQLPQHKVADLKLSPGLYFIKVYDVSTSQINTFKVVIH